MNAGAAEVALIVIAKEPLPGRCKTRLTPPLAPSQAAELAGAALTDTLRTVRAARARRYVIALEGEPGPWLPRGFEVIGQGGGGLDRRLAAAFEAVGGPALLVGMDTPQLTVAELEEAAAGLARGGVDAVLGPAADGGYWAIGLREPRAAVFDGIPMSSSQTANHQRRRLRSLGLSWRELATLRDVDTIEDAGAVASLCAGSQFARALAAVGR